MRHSITPELVRAALAHLSPDCDRDTWARVAMAIKSEFPDGTGEDLFTEWSAQASDHDPKATRDTWRSVKASGRITMGTLMHMAKAEGFDLKRAVQQTGAPPAAKPGSRNKAEREARRAAEAAAVVAGHEAAAADAVRQWDEAGPAAGAGYLARKGVQGYGVRMDAAGCLLVPMRDDAGRLWNLQRIMPTRPSASGPDKLFLKGGRKTGLWHWCGVPADAVPLLVCEGYATGASLHEATGYPVAVAFDAGNLGHVATALRKLYPAARLVVCGDDDTGTQQRTGKNPGRDKANAAARAVGGVAVFPAGLPVGGSDFNDLHGAEGLQAVRAAVASALLAPAGMQAQAEDAASRGGAAAGAGGAAMGVADRFTVDDAGVWHHGFDSKGQPLAPEWVCSPLRVEASTRDNEGNGWGFLLQFTDPAGKLKQWAMPARMLAGDGGEYRASLLHQGLRIGPSQRARNHLTTYIQTRAPEEFATCTDRVGWHGAAFVLPRETIGEQEERIVFQSEAQMENTFSSRGTVDSWRQQVAALCAGNSRLVFAASCAFAGPLLRPAGMESGGFHLRGDSSSGKTTALRVAASVYGGPGFLQRWRTTDNALEAMAAQHSDCLLCLDELAQVDPRTAGECAYMLANEQSKARATRAGLARTRLSWRLLFLSAGELGLAAHMAEGMKQARTGQEVRMADIPADAGAGMGAFEFLHGHEGGAAFSSHLARQVSVHYGSAGRAWLEWLCAHAAGLRARVRSEADALAGQLVPEAAAGQVYRVGARFALVGVAGEMATEAGLTGWAKGEATAAARACFNAWLAARGGIGNGEVVAMLRAVRGFLETHGEGRFTMWHRAADDHAPKTMQRAGVRRMLNEHGEPIKTNSQHGAEYGDRMPAASGERVSFEYFVLVETFKAEVCKGFDHAAVCRVLVDHGCLQKAEAGRYDVKQRLPGIGNARCYRILPAIFDLDL